VKRGAATGPRGSSVRPVGPLGVQRTGGRREGATLIERVGRRRGVRPPRCSDSAAHTPTCASPPSRDVPTTATELTDGSRSRVRPNASKTPPVGQGNGNTCIVSCDARRAAAATGWVRHQSSHSPVDTPQYAGQGSNVPETADGYPVRRRRPDSSRASTNTTVVGSLRASGYDGSRVTASFADATERSRRAMGRP
jgi:hypothetical protein